MSLDELQHLNKRPIRVKVFGWLDPTTGEQVVEFRVRYESMVYVASYAFPPGLRRYPELAPTALAALRRTWRALREGLRKKMHGDNFRERWRIERSKRNQLRAWEQYEAPMLGLLRARYAREGFIRRLERMFGPTPPYTGHDYTRRVTDEHRFKVQTGTY